MERRYSGPARVSGGPGTGKTIVALHRVQHLVQQLEPGSEKSVLLTTFTRNLAVDLRSRLGFLLTPEQLARVEVTHIDQLAARVLSENAGPGTSRRRIDDVEALHVLRQVHAEIGEQRFDPEFLLEEWDQVVLGRSLTTRREYFEARRAGRGRSLTRPERNQVWKLLEQFTARLDRDGVETWGQAAERAARLETERAAAVADRRQHTGESSGTRYRRHRYRHVVVDEAQDLRAAHWTMLRAMVAAGPDDLFIAGDTHQRIYDQQVTLSTVGINIRGRSSRLTLSYRTTREILARAIGIVAPGTVDYDDLDDGRDTLDGYRSVLHGPAPELVGYDSWPDELDALADVVSRWRDEIAAGDGRGRRDPRGSIAVCVADRDSVSQVVRHLVDRRPDLRRTHQGRPGRRRRRARRHHAPVQGPGVPATGHRRRPRRRHSPHGGDRALPRRRPAALPARGAQGPLAAVRRRHPRPRHAAHQLARPAEPIPPNPVKRALTSGVRVGSLRPRAPSTRRHARAAARARRDAAGRRRRSHRACPRRRRQQPVRPAIP